jgi:hypothetical protein
MEYLGCLIAVLGGAWIGALYLGVDIRHLAHAALVEAELLEKVPPELRPPAPNEKAVTREQLVATLRKELGSLRSEILALRTGASGNSSADGSAAMELAKTKTRDYWQRLSEIALGEEALQRDAEAAFNEANAAKVFAIKGRISRFAAKAVEAVPSDGVAESTVQFGRALGQWYDQAGELYERATQIWETPTGKQGRAQLNEDWKQAEAQHRNEARLIYERAASVRASISRHFGEEFCEFAKPAPASAPPAEVAPSDSSVSSAAATSGPVERATPAEKASPDAPSERVATPARPVVPPVENAVVGDTSTATD